MDLTTLINEFMKGLDITLLFAVAVVSIVLSKLFFNDKYDMLVPLVLGSLAGFVAESQTPTFHWVMAIRRSIIYGAGGFIVFALWRKRVLHLMNGKDQTKVPLTSEDEKHSPGTPTSPNLLKGGSSRDTESKPSKPC